MRMYHGHDMSSHEVVVRSLLEVLQEFDDASDGDRTTVRMCCFATQRLGCVLLPPERRFGQWCLWMWMLATSNSRSQGC